MAEAIQSFLVSDDQGKGVPGAFVYVEWLGDWNSGYTDENGVVNLEVSPILPLTAYAFKDGYVCYDFYCDRCEYKTMCYRDNFYYMPNASMTLGLKSSSCSVSTDKDTYARGETVGITYANAPSNSTLRIFSVSGSETKTWTVSGSGSKTYTIPSDATLRDWGVELYDSDCADWKDITVILAPTSANYNIVIPVGYCLWGFDWIMDNFVSKILPAITNALTDIGIGITVHGDRSYYDNEKNQIIINADIPTESPISSIVIYLILFGLTGALSPLGIWILFPLFFKTGETDQLSTFIYPVDQYHEPITEKITFKLNTGDTVSTNPPDEYFAQFTLTKGTTFSITEIISDNYRGDVEGAWKDPHEAGDRVEVVLYPKDDVDVDITVIDKGTHAPVEGVYVVLSDPFNRVVKYGFTDINGIAHITDVPKAKYTVGAYIGAEEEKIRAAETFFDTRTQTAITLEIAIEIPLSKLVYESGTLVGIENVQAELIQVSTNEIKASGTTNEAGYVRLAIKYEDAGLYKVRLSKTNYNNDEPLISEEFELSEPTSRVNYMELTGDISLVRIKPVDENNKAVYGHVTLEGYEEKTTGIDGAVTYKEVPYGNYKITVTAKDYEQVEPDKVYVVDEKTENFYPQMESTLPPNPITIECIVKDKTGEPIPNAYIDIDAQKTLLRHEYPISEAYVEVGTVTSTAFKDDGANVVTDGNGYCKFHLPGIGTEDIRGYYLRAGKPGYYNKEGKEDWTELTAMITESPASPIEFVLSPSISFIMCFFPRLYTGKPFPRIAQRNPVPRLTCLKDVWDREKPW